MSVCRSVGWGCLLLTVLVGGIGCNSSDDSDTADTDTTANTETTEDSDTSTDTTTDNNSDSDTEDSDDSTSGVSAANVLTDWIINENNELSAHIGGGTVLVNVQSVDEVSEGGASYARVQATGIPNYTLTMTQDLLNWLNDRPRASLSGGQATQSDFVSDTDNDGERNASATVGDVIAYGQDINYRSFSNDTECATNAGYGYWPPGPTCPEDTSKDAYFPVSPAVDSANDCNSGGGAVGYAVNGVSIYNWTDGQSYNSEGVWQTLAAKAEIYDVDICGGHAANGDYHHHAYSDCWADIAGEDKSGHSELYGFAADGYPVYGPFEDTNTLANSCWQVRNYDGQPSADGGWGCVGVNGGTAGDRTCVMIDPYNPDDGVDAADSNGPSTSGTYTSLSQNTFDATSGFFFEDYYFDSSCASQGGANLDEHNGHSSDSLGYHYHLTLSEMPSDSLILPEAAFPFTFGPRYYGELASNALASCSGSNGGGGNLPPPPP